MKENKKFGICPTCITYGHKLFGSQAGLCCFCKNVFCIHCDEMINRHHKCEGNIPKEVLYMLGAEINDSELIY